MPNAKNIKYPRQAGKAHRSPYSGKSGLKYKSTKARSTLIQRKAFDQPNRITNMDKFIGQMHSNTLVKSGTNSLRSGHE